MSPECQTPVLGGACYPPHLWEASVPLLYQGGAPSAPTCCSLLCFPCRSEFTDTILSVHPSDVLDMPVDPNEPTYCLCHQVSYGEMIGCDNPDCPIEWFHFACVDLTTKPKGKWSQGPLGLPAWLGVPHAMFRAPCSTRLVASVAVGVASTLITDDPGITQGRPVNLMVLSTVRSGKEEEEVRLMPGLEEQVNIFLLHVAIFSLHFKTTLFQMIFKNSVASCNSGYFLKQTRIHLSPVCTRSHLTGTRHSDFIIGDFVPPRVKPSRRAEEPSLLWGLRRGPPSLCSTVTLQLRREPARSVPASWGCTQYLWKHICPR
ncbi:uncharacterized protein LOC114203993 isoform X1 [Eumetopias jubatus]|uniref:uncharacterized protein LOC114203993 isoform X1 n=1 Tax=Eumetopias jubatus TaxID=34886 RepID=UPI0010162E44|nr:uncharacterized protein LOC114203993 isoform X1 [Eumetopias jubatus]